MLRINRQRQRYQAATLMAGVFVVGFILSFGALNVIDPKVKTSSNIAEISQPEPKKEDSAEVPSTETSDSSNAAATPERSIKVDDDESSQTPAQEKEEPSRNQSTPTTGASQPSDKQEQDKDDSALGSTLNYIIQGM